MDNMEIYEKVRSVPESACKAFSNGRFSGTDINPMWRIKALTEVFGPAGLGWYYDVVSERAETYKDNVIAIVDIKLYVKYDGEWSKPIYGTGGNVLQRGNTVSDEGYKMALTDALSVAAKALGVGADVYFSKDKTKYMESPSSTAAAAPSTRGEGFGERIATSAPPPRNDSRQQAAQDRTYRCMRCGDPVDKAVAAYSYKTFGQVLCRECQKAARSA